jgi:hypothetical protein
MMRLLLLLLAPLTWATSVEAEASSASDKKLDHGEALIEWLRSKKGFFSPKLEIRRCDPTDESSPLGMFATGAFQAKERLLLIPREMLITAEGTYEECDTVRNLVREMKLKDESKYAPYVNYLLEQPTGQLPSAWSDEGKELLLRVMGGDKLPPEDVFEHSSSTIAAE